MVLVILGLLHISFENLKLTLHFSQVSPQALKETAFVLGQFPIVLKRV